MSRAAYNPKFGQIIKTDAGGSVDWDFIAHYTITAAQAVAAGAATVKTAVTLADGVTTTVLAAALTAQPPTPRVLSITGNAATATGNVVITGTDFSGATLVETIISTGAATVLGVKAFATIANIVFPARGAGGDTISVGTSDKFGIPYLLPFAGAVILLVNNGTATTVAAGSSFSATVLADNFIDPTAALNAQQVDVYMIV
jgi:hypothetical protein